MPRRRFQLPHEKKEKPSMYTPKRPRLMSIATEVVLDHSSSSTTTGPGILHADTVNAESGSSFFACTKNGEGENPIQKMDVAVMENAVHYDDDDTTANDIHSSSSRSDSIVENNYQHKFDPQARMYPFLSDFDVEAASEVESIVLPDQISIVNEQVCSSNTPPPPSLPIVGNNIRMGIELLRMCSQAQVPLDFYNELLRLLKRYHAVGVSVTTVPTRAQLVKHLKSKIDVIEPDIVAVTGTQDIVPKFSLLAQLTDLLSTEYFQTFESCCVNSLEESRFLKYQPPTEEGLSEVLGGTWYQQTYDKVIGQQTTYLDPVTRVEYHNWLLPVIFYNDKTGVSAMEGTYSLEPLMFTLGVIRRTCREKADAWRHVGFIPTRTATKKMNDDNGCAAEQNLAFTHQCLSILLQDLIDLQASPPLLTLQLFDGRLYNVRLLLEVAFVIGDQLSQDTHCCRKKVNAGGAGRVHRSCLASFLDASNIQPNGCTIIPKEVLDNLSESIWLWENDTKRSEFFGQTNMSVPNDSRRQSENLLKMFVKQRSQVSRQILERVFSLYPVCNAWSRVSFGSNKEGIHRATVDDPMHYNSAGLFSYLAQVAFGGLHPKEAKELEDYMRADFSKRSSVRYDLPRGKFASGFTNCTLLTASEKVGLMYSLYLGLGTPRIADIYQTSILRQQQKYSNVMCSVPDPNSSVGGSSNLPHLGDKYFFKKIPIGGDKINQQMTRNLGSVRRMVNDLNSLCLLQGMEKVVLCFDSLQTEFLLHALYDNNRKNKGHVSAPTCLPLSLSSQQVTSVSTLEAITKHLNSKLRRKKETVSKQMHQFPAIPTVIQKRIVKHWIDKPKINGSGDTSAILTDVDGFRTVLEHALLFHATIHEFHQLAPSFQLDFKRLKSKLDNLMSKILAKIYRGDNGVDVQTCKCHSHLHLTADIQYFGAPMGFDASKGERNLKSWAKQVSKTARKCGQSLFMEQTAKRVSDQLLLQRAAHMFSFADPRKKRKVPKDISCDNREGKWKYTRRKHHMEYDLGTGSASLFANPSTKPSNCFDLLTNQVTQVLRDTHGPVGEIRIWKEIQVDLGEGHGKHYVRAFHLFDEHGPFFDWVHVHDNDNTDSYRPAKVLLLYQTEGQHDFALVWKAKGPTMSERRLETNLSARWKMTLKSSGLPCIVSIPTNQIDRCILVYEHWKCLNRNHLPTTVLPHGSDTSMFSIDEAYDRYSWVLNYLDDDRWSPDTSTTMT